MFTSATESTTESTTDVDKINAGIDTLYQLSDMSAEDYEKIKEHYLSKGQSNNLIKTLKSRCKLPNIRNTVRPLGEIYAPVHYTADYLLKYVNKPRWGDIVTIVFWDLLVLDIDDKESLPYIKKRITHYYPEATFYIRETPRGYHLFLVSRTVNHASKYAIYMRKKIGTDPAHGANSLYTGASLRLTRKNCDPEGAPVSVFLEQFGTGEIDPKAVGLYNTYVHWLDYFRQRGLVMQDLSDLWKSIPWDFGKQHVAASAPSVFTDEPPLSPNTMILNQNIGHLLYDQDVKATWAKFIRYINYRLTDLPILLIGAQYQMSYENLYRILESTEEYAVGVHVQHNTYFISYRDLLMIDYDHKSRLSIIARFSRKNPEYVFRVVRTPKGYHVFLTSHRMPHSSRKSLEFLWNLRSDPAHILGIHHRGYSVRVNQKSPDERGYKEVYTYGKGVEIPELVILYRKHLDLYSRHAAERTLICNYQIKTAAKILSQEGPMVVY